MGVTRLATCIEELLEACGDPDDMLDSLRHARRVAGGLSTAGDSFIDGGSSDDDDDDDDGSGSSSSSTSSSSSGSDDFTTPRDDDVAGAAAVDEGAQQPRLAGDGKRYEGTDEERAERLARMMAAQCTMEAPEKVGLRTGWKPSSSGFGVVPDGSSPSSSGIGAWNPASGGGAAGIGAWKPPAAATSVTSAATPVPPAGIAAPAAGFRFAFTPPAAPSPAPAPSTSDTATVDVGATIVAAQRAYVSVVASSDGVDGAEVPRSGREAYIALHRCYKFNNLLS